MAKALIEIDLDNDAFTDSRELPRIFRQLAVDVDSWAASRFASHVNIRDINGNTVGTFKIVDPHVITQEDLLNF